MSKYTLSSKTELAKRIKKLIRERDKWEHEAILRGKEVVKIRRLMLNFEHQIDDVLFDEMKNVFGEFWDRNDCKLKGKSDG